MEKPTVGEPNRSLMLRIAEAFEKSARHFADENMRLAKLGAAVGKTTPKGRVDLMDGVWVDFEADKDTAVTIQPGADRQGLRLTLEDIGSSRWFSFAYSLKADELRTARYVGLLIRADSTGLAAFRPCLRYLLEDGFKDRFPSSVVVLSGGEDEQLCFLKVDPELAAKARGTEILFFFEGSAFDVTLLEIENLHI